MKQELEKFLNDNTQTEIELSNPFRTIKLYKEKFDERFVVIQLKPKTKFLKQEGYDVAGYYDTKEKKMYEISRTFEEFITKVDNIEIIKFMDVEQELIKKIDESVSEYVIAHPKKFKNSAEEKYNYEAEWLESRLKSEAHRQFIRCDDLSVPMDLNHARRTILDQNDYRSLNVYYKYLTEPEKTIDFYKKIILDKYCEEIGMELLKKEASEKYLNTIVKNENNNFEAIYLNKKLLNSIKDVYAKTITITINYNNKELTFKYDYEQFKRDLQNCEKGSSSYGSSYDIVSNFVKDNSPSVTERYRCDFDFNKITSITYGKNVLYTRDEINFEKENDNDEIELEI